MNTLEILQKLITFPSFVDKNNNEGNIGHWIYEYLQINTKLMLSKQYISESRFNIIATNSDKPKNLITGHIDTVQPTESWTFNPFAPKIINDKLYGLGSSDMKSGIAIMLSLATNLKLKDKTMFLLYCDEEYDFLGMKKFISKYKTKIYPQLIISLDGDSLQIGNSCRGLVELKVSVQGKAAHSSKPKSGINAITESQNVIGKLKVWLEKYSSNELGNSTLNIAYIRGGTKIGVKNDEIYLGREGNVIPDFCEYIVEVRVASGKLNANLLKDYIITELKKLGLIVNEIQIRHDLGYWITPENKLKNIISVSANKSLSNAKERGYIDIEMLWKTFNKVPTFCFGAGESGMAHKADEFVRISQVIKAERFFEKILLK